MDDSSLLDELIFAIEEFDCVAIRKLVAAHGPRVLLLNVLDRVGLPLLHLAIDVEIDYANSQGRHEPLPDMTKCLLDLGADPNQKDRRGRSAGEYAVYRAHPGAAELLAQP